ncbi:hypothetical protein AK812_SmicGene46796 [Symbiodinium microadriaticum]|uniref:Uncharacterized protein n=1 Tax=Symbiodinium microadriaticum TaxID=2951 RepID=A0A1Q9BT70_SYMMI|nr:hypothetical protein AK812_SmicGene46796 [Symbiodinium microadriaticum]CAE7273901.1 unnamed protein product [Symbiodinium microadriaticum]
MCDPASGKVRVAHLHSMLFGAVAAVHAFLRCSEALKALGREKFALVMTSFFDDFTVITQKCHARHVSAVVSNFFSKLGWQVAAEPKTNVDFSEVFDVAGVRVALPGREWYLYRTSQAGPLSSASCSVMPWTVDPSRQTRLKDSDLFVWVDNDAAHASLSKAFTRVSEGSSDRSSPSSSTATEELLQQSVTGLERQVNQLSQQVRELQDLVSALQVDRDQHRLRLHWLERFVQEVRRAVHGLLSADTSSLAACLFDLFAVLNRDV